MTALSILLVVVAAAVLVGLVQRRRSGRLRVTAPSGPQRSELLATAGVAAGRPAVLHFSADWCAPCAAVRTVVSQAVTELADQPNPPADIELDIDRNPSLAKELGVLSLPTTFIFDAELIERFRISGVPAVADLRSALSPLSRKG
ncbi:thioredoxin family protein [Skermania piniformis]|uniref:Thioredoxin family protein n=1 Tax=Skermania pinensis TaxID=39122 RepID=A0ABX8S7K9_9ACTN|nr:thioredoxin family protein [Skermania piniformis]QXQ13451.1 thioredoxin family protein [Skermania piniformis]